MSAQQEQYKYLLKRSGIYSFRRAVPRELQAAFGAIQVWKSLGTPDLPRAVDLLASEVAAFDARMIRARRVLGLASAEDELQQHHIRRLCERYRAIVLDTDDDERRGLTDTDVAERRTMLSEMLAEKEYAAADGDIGIVAETAETLLSAEGLRPSRDRQLQQQLLRALLLVDVDTLKVQVDRLVGKSVPTPPMPEPAVVAARLQDIVPQWVVNQAPAPKTVWEVEKAIQRFERVCGQLCLVDITAEHARRYRDYLLNGKSQEGKVLQRSLARKTIKKQLSLLGAIFTVAIDQEEHGVTENPFRGIALWKMDAKSHRRKSRRPFEAAELQRLFDSKLYRGGYRPRGPIGEAAYWMPLLATFTGARPEELGQLKVEDVFPIGDAWVLRICNLDAEQQLKTADSFRRVPVHTELFRCGFLDYHHAMGTAGEKFLFPQLEQDPFGKRTFKFGKWANRYMDSLGLDDPNLDFYSLRATFKDFCRIAGIGEEVHDAITGHRPAGRQVSRTYGAAAYPLPPLLDAMSKFQLVGVDLSHIHVSVT